MGGRLLPLLALLGAAVAFDWCARLNPCLNGGSCFLLGSAWVCRCPRRWRGERCQTGPESAELTESPPPRPPSSLSSSQAEHPHGFGHPGPTPKAATWHLSPAASRTAEMQTGSAAAERTSAAGRRERGESPSPSESSGQPHPAPTAAPTFLLPSMVQAWLSLSTSPADATVHEPSPLPLAGRVPTEGVPEGWQAMGSSQGPGTGGQLAMRPPLGEPTSEATWAPAAAGNEASGTTAVPPLRSPGIQEEGATLPHMELPSPSLAAVGQPVRGSTQAAPGWSADSAEIPERDVAALAELAGGGSAAPQTAGPEELPWPSEGSEAYGESERNPVRPSAATRHPEVLLLPGPTLPQPLAPPRPSVGLDLTAVEGTTPGDPAGSVGPAAPHNKAPGQRSSAGEWPSSTPPPSAGVPSAVVSGSGASLHPTSSSYQSATLALSPDSLLYHTGHAPTASLLAPSPSPPLGPGGLPAGLSRETGALATAQDGRWKMAVLPTSTGPLPVPSSKPLHTPGSPHTPVARQFTEPFSTQSDLAPSTPTLMQTPSRRVAERGTSSSPGSSSRETSARATGGAGWSAGSGKRPQTATPGEAFPREAAPRQAGQPAGETTDAAEPSASRILGEGASATWGPAGPTESQTSSASATREDSAHSRGPGPHFQTALFSSSASAAAAPPNQAGKTLALSHVSVTHRSWSPPARTWGWSVASRPTESPAREPPHSPRGMGGPLTTAGNSWHTWPPARGDPPIASTWLLAVVPEAVTWLAPAAPREVRPRAQHVFVAENQPPALKAAFLHLPWELFLAMEFPRGFGSPHSPEYQGLVLNINATVAPLFAPLPGFQRLEVRRIRPGGVVVLADAIFLAEAPGLWAALNRPGPWKELPPGLWVANASVVWSMALERPPDLCAELFSCPAGYDCIVGEDGNPTCASMCHRPYCKNQGICTHLVNQTPVCQCPVGSDFWFLGVRCDYKVTQQGLLGVACGLLLSLLAIGAAIFGLVVRRVRMLLLEARADQTKSSYRRFCRLDDVSAHYWSEPWLASVNSLDNPAFSNSEELLQLQILEPGRCGCQDPCLATEGYRKPLQGAPSRAAAGRPRSLSSWERSSGSGNEHMIDSGKASEVSVSSWPLEPIHWSPSSPPTRHDRPHQPMHNGRRPHSYCEGMELINLERSWTA